MRNTNGKYTELLYLPVGVIITYYRSSSHYFNMHVEAKYMYQEQHIFTFFQKKVNFLLFFESFYK